MLNQNRYDKIIINEHFQHFADKLLGAQTFGVGRKPIEIDSTDSSNTQKPDRFTLCIPYAGSQMSWTVLFNSNYPDMGPDFFFNHKTFMADPDIYVIEKYIPSLARWEAANPESLLKVLNELVAYYTHHQINVLKDTERELYEGCKRLIDHMGIKVNDIEILLPSERAPTISPRFMIRLKVNTSRLPGRKIKAENQTATLVITYELLSPREWSTFEPQLLLSNDLMRAFNDLELRPLGLPPIAGGQTLADYVLEVDKYLSKTVDSVVFHYEKRKNFIATMLYLQRRNVIEYNATNFTSITILLEDQDFYFLVHFILTSQFPYEEPKVAISSIYHVDDLDDLIKICPRPIPSYNPTWTPHRMITVILEQIITGDVKKLKDKTTSYLTRR